MKHIKTTVRVLHLCGSSYEIGYRLGTMISKDAVWRKRYITPNCTMMQNRFEKVNSLLDI